MRESLFTAFLASLRRCLIYDQIRTNLSLSLDRRSVIEHSRNAQFQEAWTSAKKDGLEHLVKEKLPKVEEKKIDDLLIILERHFDPEKKPKARLAPEKRSFKSKSQKVNDDKENNNKCDLGTETPDTTTSGSPIKVDVEIML